MLKLTVDVAREENEKGIAKGKKSSKRSKKKSGKNSKKKGSEPRRKISVKILPSVLNYDYEGNVAIWE